jgi:hypothetical protein
MTWWLNTTFFIRTITTVIKSITMEFLADAQIVGTPELIDKAVASLLTCRKITTLITHGLQQFLESWYMAFLPIYVCEKNLSIMTSDFYYLRLLCYMS